MIRYGNAKQYYENSLNRLSALSICRWYKRTVFDIKPKTVEKWTGAEIGRGMMGREGGGL